MRINNPKELVEKEVCDANGITIGTIDKCWNSWNSEYPGYFFGIRPTENTRDTWFRGTTKLIPIYSDYIKEYDEHVTLNKTTYELCRFWNKSIHYGITTCTTEEMVDKTIYDKNYSRVGTIHGWVESDGTFKHYGCFVDPFLCDSWKMQYDTLMPVPPDFLYYVKDTITLDKTLDELKEYWKKFHKI
jgi:hypothetical protein